MNLIKVVIAFIAVGGAGYALFKIDKDTPQWLKTVTYIMAFAALIVAIIALPDALRALEQSVAIITGWMPNGPIRLNFDLGPLFRVLDSVAGSFRSNPNSLDVSLGNLYHNTLYVKFFTEGGHSVWPAPPNSYVLNAGETQVFSLQCTSGQKICFGAFTADRNMTWGVGEYYNQGCDRCCFHCGQGRVGTNLTR